MKKILLLLIAVAFIGLNGCAVTHTKSTSIAILRPGPDPDAVRPLPLTADLNISEQKVRGEATGKLINPALGEDAVKQLTRVATARALGQDPPRVDGPDVLVAMNVYTEPRKRDSVRVVVTGYPAWYHNFRITEETGDTTWLLLRNTSGEGAKIGGQGGSGLRLGDQSPDLGAYRLKKAGNAKVTAETHWGIRANALFNFMSNDESGAPDIDAGFMWAFGLALKFPVSGDVSINTGVDYKFGTLGSYEYSSSQNSVEVKATEMGILIPVFGHYTLPVGYPVYVGVGVQLGINFLGEIEVSSSGNPKTGNDWDERSAIDFGLGFGVGYMVLPGLDVGLRWIFNVNTPEKDLDKESLSTLSIGATYSF